MTREFLLGLDLGRSDRAGSRAEAARQAGAGLARVRFALGGRPLLDAQYLDLAHEHVRAVRAAGLAVLAVVDSDLTAAPAGAGAFAETPPDMLARAWTDEMAANTSTLAAALGAEVAWWEVLPLPNTGAPPRIAPLRWAELATRVAQAIRNGAPGARIASGALASDEADDGVEYLRAAWRASEAAGLWPSGAPPVDAVGLRLAILPDGGAAEEAVSAAVRERVQRVWRTLEQLVGPDEARAPSILVTGLGWDAARAGETVQARNLWAALDALSTDPVVSGAVWDGLQDEPQESAGASQAGRTGLFRSTGLDAADRRPAWQAFNDFSVYLRQIAASPAVDWLGEPEPGGPEPEVFPPAPEAAAEAPPSAAAAPEPARESALDEAALVAGLAAAEAALPEPEVYPPPLVVEPAAPAEAPPAEAAAEAEAAVADTPESPFAGLPEPIIGGAFAAAALAAGTDAAPEPDAADEPPDEGMADDEPLAATGGTEGDGEGEGLAAAGAALAAAGAADEPEPEAAAEPALPSGEIAFRIPSAMEVLKGQGLTDEALGLALAAIAARLGDPERLGPGDYRVSLAPPEPPAFPTGPYTNQQVISALYRAAGGSWALFERTGLVLSELAGHRNEPYDGPALDALEGLSPEERQAVATELEQLDRSAASTAGD